MIAILALALALVGNLALMLRLGGLVRRVEALERRPREPSRAEALEAKPRPLQGLRVAVHVAQDHSRPVFAERLREALFREEALMDDGDPDVTIEGRLVCNGYAEVYYRADLTVRLRGEALFTLDDRPPHGDRPENLALEVVERLEIEWAKRERQAALRELG